MGLPDLGQFEDGRPGGVPPIYSKSKSVRRDTECHVAFASRTPRTPLLIGALGCVQDIWLEIKRGVRGVRFHIMFSLQKPSVKIKGRFHIDF